MTNEEIITLARDLLDGKVTIIEAYTAVQFGVERICMETAYYVLRGEPYYFHAHSRSVLRPLQIFAAANGWTVTELGCETVMVAPTRQ